MKCRGATLSIYSVCIQGLFFFGIPDQLLSSVLFQTLQPFDLNLPAGLLYLLDRYFTLLHTWRTQKTPACTKP